MKEIIIEKNDANQTLIKLLHKYLKEAPNSFLYKMLRKKNIVLNGKKATGNERLNPSDRVTIFLSDETYYKFAGSEQTDSEYDFFANLKLPVLDIVYEDEDILVLNKPVGMLSQKAKPEDLSANEYIIAYCIQKGTLTKQAFSGFRPSICNRLDRNTCGLLIAGKSLQGLQQMAEALKTRTVEKYYYCIVKGHLTNKEHCKAYLSKDDTNNKVTIKESEFSGSHYIETAYEPIATNQQMTLVKVHLITGKTHQIRAHLAYKGYPLLGDTKYGDGKTNNYIQNKYNIHSQLLCAKEMLFKDGLHLQIDLPDSFRLIMKEEHIL